jgi:hypothetical protein
MLASQPGSWAPAEGCLAPTGGRPLPARVAAISATAPTTTAKALTARTVGPRPDPGQTLGAIGSTL